MDNQDRISVSPKKKGSSFKRSLMWLLVLGIIGGSGYVAYGQGVLDRYLPQQLKFKAETSAVIAKNTVPTSPTSAAMPASAPESAPPAVVAAPIVDDKTPVTSIDTQSNLQATLEQQTQRQIQPQTQQQNVEATPTPNTKVAEVNSVSPTTSPIVLSINGAPANALLTAYDAQWQWLMVQQNFTRHADAALALQDIQNIKAQLQATKDSVFIPALSALAQTETQLQAWTHVPSAEYLTSLQQAIVAVDQIEVKSREDITAVPVSNLSWWERIIASMKNVIEIKKINGAKETQILNSATAAVVKQSISARLLSAQWAAQAGQWGNAQSAAKDAYKMAMQWSDASALEPVKALVDAKDFPSVPEFDAVTSALQQARAQLISAARVQQGYSAPVMQVVPVPAKPMATTPTISTPAQKGGA